MKKYLPYITIIIIGLAISVFSYTKLGIIAGEGKETIKIVVPVSDIPAYKEIQPTDLGYKEVLVSEVSEDTITDPQSIIGKQAKASLYADWAINKNLIEEKKQFKEKHIVAINIDYARSAGAKPGDIVDVYFVKPLKSEWTASNWSERVASEVIVLSIEGTENKGASASSMGTAILAVDKNSTHKLTPGATKENDRYVLAIRQQITKEPEIAPITENNKEDIENTKEGEQLRGDR